MYGVVVSSLLALVVGSGLRKVMHPAGPNPNDELPASSLARGALRVQFFGTTSLLFRDGQNAVMVDAFLSRPALLEVLFRKIASNAAQVTEDLAKAKVEHVDILLVSHSHFDHVFDAPILAKQTGALLVGSPSTYEVGLGGGVSPEQMKVVQGGQTLEAGRFRVTVFQSVHSPGDKVPGEINSPLKQPASIRSYREGGTFSYLIEHDGTRIIVHPSANYVPGMYKGVRADVVFLSIGGLGSQAKGFADAYWQEVVESTGARLVIPIHWDDFTQPLDEPLVPMPRFMDDFSKATDSIYPLARRDAIDIRYMPLFAPVSLEAPDLQR